MKYKAIYPGTFDPITNGHLDIIKRAFDLFPQLIVAVADNRVKNPFFSLETRMDLIREALISYPDILVIGFNTLLVDFARMHQTKIILRGLRAVNDFEYEFQLAGMNRKLAPEIETIFLTPSEDVLFVSSSLVREIMRLNGDVSQFVPSSVVKAFKRHCKNK